MSTVPTFMSSSRRSDPHYTVYSSTNPDCNDSTKKTQFTNFNPNFEPHDVSSADGRVTNIELCVKNARNGVLLHDTTQPMFKQQGPNDAVNIILTATSTQSSNGLNYPHLDQFEQDINTKLNANEKNPKFSTLLPIPDPLSAHSFEKIIPKYSHTHRYLRHVTFNPEVAKLGPPAKEPQNVDIFWANKNNQHYIIPDAEYKTLLQLDPNVASGWNKIIHLPQAHIVNNKFDQLYQNEVELFKQQALLQNLPTVPAADNFKIDNFDMKTFFKQIHGTSAININYRERFIYTDHINSKQYSRSNASIFYLIRRAFSSPQQRKEALDYFTRRYIHIQRTAFTQLTMSIAQDSHPYEIKSFNDPYFDSDEYIALLIEKIASFHSRQSLSWSQDEILATISQMDYLTLDAILLCGGHLQLDDFEQDFDNGKNGIENSKIGTENSVNFSINVGNNNNSNNNDNINDIDEEYIPPNSIFRHSGSGNSSNLPKTSKNSSNTSLLQPLSVQPTHKVQYKTLAFIRLIKILFLNHFKQIPELFCQIGLFYQYQIHLTRDIKDHTISPELLHYFLSLFPAQINTIFPNYGSFLNIITAVPCVDQQLLLVQLAIQHGIRFCTPNDGITTPGEKKQPFKIHNPLLNLVKHYGNMATLRYLCEDGKFPVYLPYLDETMTLEYDNNGFPINYPKPTQESLILEIYNNALAYYKPYIAYQLEKYGLLPILSKETVINKLSLLLNLPPGVKTYDYRHIPLPLDIPNEYPDKDFYENEFENVLKQIDDPFCAFFENKYGIRKLNDNEKSKSSSFLRRGSLNQSYRQSSITNHPTTPRSANSSISTPTRPLTSNNLPENSITIKESRNENNDDNLEDKSEEKSEDKSEDNKIETELDIPTYDVAMQAPTTSPIPPPVQAPSIAPVPRKRNPLAALMAKTNDTPTPVPEQTTPLPAAVRPTSTATNDSSSNTDNRPLTAHGKGLEPENINFSLPISIRANIFTAIRRHFDFPQHQYLALDILLTEFRFVPAADNILSHTYPSLLSHQSMRIGFDDENYAKSVIVEAKNCLIDFYQVFCSNPLFYQTEFLTHLRNYKEYYINNPDKINEYGGYNDDPSMMLHLPNRDLHSLFSFYLSPHKLQAPFAPYFLNNSRQSPLINSLQSESPSKLDALFLLHSTSLIHQRDLIFTYDVLNRLPQTLPPENYILGHNFKETIESSLLWDYIIINPTKISITLQLLAIIIRYTSHDHLFLPPLFLRESIAYSYMGFIHQKMQGNKPVPRSVPAEPFILALTMNQTPSFTTHLTAFGYLNKNSLQQQQQQQHQQQEFTPFLETPNSKDFGSKLLQFEQTQQYRGQHFMHIVSQWPSLDTIQLLPSLPPIQSSVTTIQLGSFLPPNLTIPQNEYTIKQRVIGTAPGKVWDYVQNYFSNGPNYAGVSNTTAPTNLQSFSKIVNILDAYNNTPLMFVVAGVNNTNVIKTSFLEKWNADMTAINHHQVNAGLIARHEYRSIFTGTLPPHMAGIKDWMLELTNGQTQIDFRLALDPKSTPPTSPSTVTRNSRDPHGGYFSPECATYFRNLQKKTIIGHILTNFNVLSPGIFSILLLFRSLFQHVKHPLHQNIYPATMIQYDDPLFDTQGYWDAIFDKLNVLILRFQARKQHHDLFPFYLQADPIFFPNLIPQLYLATSQYDYHMVEALILCGCEPNSVTRNVSQLLPLQLPPIFYLFEYHGIIGTSKTSTLNSINSGSVNSASCFTQNTVSAYQMSSISRIVAPICKATVSSPPSSNVSLDTYKQLPDVITNEYIQHALNGVFKGTILLTMMVLLRYRASTSLPCPRPVTPDHPQAHNITLLQAVMRFYSRVLFSHQIGPYIQRTCSQLGLPCIEGTLEDILARHYEILTKLLSFVGYNIDKKFLNQRGCQMEFFIHELFNSPNLDLYSKLIFSIFSESIVANKNTQDMFGNTILHYAVTKPGNSKIIHTLVDNFQLNPHQPSLLTKSTPIDLSLPQYYLQLQGSEKYDKKIAQKFLSAILSPASVLYTQSRAKDGDVITYGATDDGEDKFGLNYNLFYEPFQTHIGKDHPEYEFEPSYSPLSRDCKLDLLAPWISFSSPLHLTHSNLRVEKSLTDSLPQYKKLRQNSIFYHIFNALGSDPDALLLTFKLLRTNYVQDSAIIKHNTSIYTQLTAGIHPNAVFAPNLTLEHLIPDNDDDGDGDDNDDNDDNQNGDIAMNAGSGWLEDIFSDGFGKLCQGFVRIVEQYQNYVTNVKTFDQKYVKQAENDPTMSTKSAYFVYPFSIWLGLPENHPMINVLGANGTNVDQSRPNTDLFNELNNVTTRQNIHSTILPHPTRALKAFAEHDLPMIEALLILGLDPNFAFFPYSPPIQSIEDKSTKQNNWIPYTPIFAFGHPANKQNLFDFENEQNLDLFLNKKIQNSQGNLIKLLLRYGANIAIPTCTRVTPFEYHNIPYATRVITIPKQYQSVIVYLMQHYMHRFRALFVIKTQQSSFPSTKIITELKQKFLQLISMCIKQFDYHYLAIVKSGEDKSYTSTNKFPQVHQLLTTYNNINVLHLLFQLNDIDSIHKDLFVLFWNFLPEKTRPLFLLQQDHQLNTPIHYLVRNSGNVNTLMTVLKAFDHVEGVLKHPFGVTNKKLFYPLDLALPEYYLQLLNYFSNRTQFIKQDSLFTPMMKSVLTVFEKNIKSVNDDPSKLTLIEILYQNIIDNDENIIDPRKNVVEIDNPDAEIKTQSGAKIKKEPLLTSFFAPITINTVLDGSKSATVTNNLLSLLAFDIELTYEERMYMILALFLQLIKTNSTLRPNIPFSYSTKKRPNFVTERIKVNFVSIWLEFIFSLLVLISQSKTAFALAVQSRSNNNTLLNIPYESLLGQYSYNIQTQEVTPLLYTYLAEKNLTGIMTLLLLHIAPQGSLIDVVTVDQEQERVMGSFFQHLQIPLTLPRFKLRSHFPILTTSNKQLFTPISFLFADAIQIWSKDDEKDTNGADFWSFLTLLLETHRQIVNWITLPTITVTNNNDPIETQETTFSIPILALSLLQDVLSTQELNMFAQKSMSLFTKALGQVLSPSNVNKIANNDNGMINNDDILFKLSGPTMPLLLFKLSSTPNLNLISDNLINFSFSFLASIYKITNLEEFFSIPSTLTGDTILHLLVGYPNNSNVISHLIKTYPSLLKLKNNSGNSPNLGSLPEYTSLFPPSLPTRSPKPQPPLPTRIVQTPATSLALDAPEDITSLTAPEISLSLSSHLPPRPSISPPNNPISPLPSLPPRRSSIPPPESSQTSQEQLNPPELVQTPSQPQTPRPSIPAPIAPRGPPPLIQIPTSNSATVEPLQSTTNSQTSVNPSPSGSGNLPPRPLAKKPSPMNPPPIPSSSAPTSIAAPESESTPPPVVGNKLPPRPPPAMTAPVASLPPCLPNSTPAGPPPFQKPPGGGPPPPPSIPAPIAALPPPLPNSSSVGAAPPLPTRRAALPPPK